MKLIVYNKEIENTYFKYFRSLGMCVQQKHSSFNIWIQEKI